MVSSVFSWTDTFWAAPNNSTHAAVLTLEVERVTGTGFH